MDIITVLQVMIGIIVFIMIALVFLYIYLVRPKKEKSEKVINTAYADDLKETETKKIEKYGRFQGELTQESIFDFMEFDEVIDNMIVRKNKTQYVMVLQCNGVNYDLMSEQEKIAVEEGFVQFLNTLRFPIQLYVQSRTLNLKEIIDTYQNRVNAVASDLEKLDEKIIQAQKANNKPLLEKLEFEKRRKKNVLDYGIDITDYIGRLNSNEDILQQRTYVIVSFFVNELGSGLENYAKDEIDNMCFSELYTRCQNVASALAGSQVTSKILDSEELIELLYIAYNRDESEIYQLSKALDAQYDALYSTGKDILQKKQEKLDKEINIAAIDLATDSILRADKQKQLEDLEREKSKTVKIKQKASELLNQYENQLNPRVFQIAKENIQKGPQDENSTKTKIQEKKQTEIKESGKVVRKTTIKSKNETQVKKKVEENQEILPKKKIVKKKKIED